MPEPNYQPHDTYEGDAGIHRLFEWQAERTPDACAILFKDKSLTYRELDCRANRLAWNLVNLGVGPDVTVGIFAERSIEAIVGLLGILKAGGTCLPLDPEFPKERISFMLQDGDVRYLLVDEKFFGRLPENTPRIVWLAADTEPGDVPTYGPESPVSSENVAYTIYTSGSTGKPKGVDVTHQGIVRLLCGVDYINLDQTKTVLQISALTFDGSIFEIWGALLHGARCVLYPGRIPLVSELGNLLRQHRVTTALLTTSVFNAIVDEDATALASLQQLIVAGEAISVQHVSRAWDHLGHVEIINGYGPTEATVFACAYRIPKEPDPMATSIPIGRPIGNARAYILDPDLQPVPIGVSGDLYVGGPGVARGYRNRPELTLQRFIPDPFSREPGARLYKTGDVARTLADGNIDFLGRLDDQVKIRGFRIELGEIEASLRRHEGVRDALVLSYRDSHGDNRLSAFVVRKPGLQLSADELREFLRQSLPKFMIPSRCRVLDRWPLTSSGKVDRQALATEGVASGKGSSETIPPRTNLENELVEIWEELLDVRPIAIRDSFFDLGGDSLDAVRLLAQLEKVFDKRLPMGAFLGAATIEQLAVLLRQSEAEDRLAYVVPLQSKGENPIFFCVGPSWLYRPFSLQLGPDQPVYSIDLDPEYSDQLRELFQMEKLARHLVVALQERQPEGPYYLGGFCANGVIAYEVARQLAANGQNVGLLVLFDSVNPCPGTSTRIATGLRRAVIRCRHHVTEILRLDISGITLYVRKALKCKLTQMLERMSGHFQLSKREADPPDVGKIRARAASSYKPKPLACPTIIFRCKDYPVAAAGDPYVGWRKLLTGRCETYEVPGDHAGILSGANVKTLADQLGACLRTAKQPAGTPLQVTLDYVRKTI